MKMTNSNLMKQIRNAERQMDENGRLNDRTYLSLNRKAMELRAVGNDELADKIEDITCNG